MQGPEVYDVLEGIGATGLHHANSVTTSCTFLEQGGLLSRGFVEDHKLLQTPQAASDEIDKKYGIWDRIFLDHVDIHERAGRRKGPNQYGPVLFVFPLEILLGLPTGTEILVTRRNPIYWYDGQADNGRWYENAEDLAGNIRFGDFDKMLVVRTPSEVLAFPNGRARVFLDDPQRGLASGENAYAHAEGRLTAAAAAGGVALSVGRHGCRDGCSCIEKYGAYGVEKLDKYFL